MSRADPMEARSAVIRFHSNSRQNAALRLDLEAALLSVDLTDDDASKNATAALETDLSQYLDIPSVVTVSSGTDGLVIALRALGLPPGSEVITCSFGFYATPAAIIMAGHVPVFVDVVEGGMVMDIDAAAAAVTPRTGAILGVHMFGETLDPDRLGTLAESVGVPLVEDVAQAIGARRHGRAAGSWGRVSVTSFNWSKHLSSFSDGGAVFTSDPDLDAELRRLRAYGGAGGFRHTGLGLNSRLNPFEAVMLRVKLRHLDTWLDRRRDIATRYSKAFGSMEGIVAPSVITDRSHVFHKYTIQVQDRDALRDRLAEKGYRTMVCYPLPLPDQPAFASSPLVVHQDDRTRRLVGRVISLPVFPEFSDAEVDEVIDTVEQHLLGTS